MKNKKNICSIFVALIMMLFCVQPIMIYAQEDTNDLQEEVIEDEILEYYTGDPEYNKMRNYSPKLAEEYIDALVQDKISYAYDISPTSTDSYGTIAYCTVPVIEQSTSSNCSAATLLQTMYGLGKQGNVVGSTYAQKQSTLYNYTSNTSAPGARIESTPGTSLWVYEIVLYLNSHLSTNLYSYKQGYNMSISEFKTDIWDSLVHNRPVMLHAYTEYLGYYNGTGLYHYLSLDYYDRSREVVRIKDCNFDDNYGGSHSGVPVEEAFATIKRVSNRYLISN